jgi:tight adherence protein B
MNPIGVPFLVALVVSFAVLLLVLRPAAGSKCTQQRLTSIQESLQAHAAAADGKELEKAEPWGYWVHLDSLLSRFQFSKRLNVLLIHANSEMGAGGVVLASLGAGAACGLVSYLFLRIALVSGAFIFAGSTIPYIVLRLKRSHRLKAFNLALPDAIDLMARALVAGHSIGSSIEMVAEESPEPLAFEFVQVYQQQRLGLHFRDALLQMGSRVPSRDLQFLVTAILVQKETGGDLTEILARTSYVIRERVRIEGEVRTRTAQGRLTGWILGLLPIVMLVLINVVSPGYSDVLFHDPLGQKLLYAGGGLIVVGALIIRKIVDVQV